MGKKYFMVEAKCGHVGGANFYIKNNYYVKAASGSEAAAIVRARPRVKHDRKDAIISVTKISYFEYRKGLEVFINDPYNQCQSKQEQLLILEQIRDRILPEETYRRTVSNLYGDKQFDDGKSNIKKASKFGYDKHNKLNTRGQYKYVDLNFHDMVA